MRVKALNKQYLSSLIKVESLCRGFVMKIVFLVVDSGVPELLVWVRLAPGCTPGFSRYKLILTIWFIKTSKKLNTRLKLEFHIYLSFQSDSVNL